MRKDATAVIVTTTDEITKIIDQAFEKHLTKIKTEGPKSIETREDLLTVAELAKYLKVSRQTIHNWKRDGLIPFHRKGRRVYFKLSEVINQNSKVLIRSLRALPGET